MRGSAENARTLASILDEFGFGGVGIKESDFLQTEQVIQLGRAPHRIDLLTSISGVFWEVAWADREFANIAGSRVPMISRATLLVNKRASGRPQDLADVARLESKNG